MQKSKRLALSMVVLGVSGALINLIFQRTLGLVLFALMAIVGIIILIQERATQT
ncbi:MAG: hypothetical protein QXV21_02550 [Candidatus Bathyarchaeia archaeon]